MKYNYSNHLNSEQLKSKHKTLRTLFVWFSNGWIRWLGGPVKYQTFWTINKKKFVWFSDNFFIVAYFFWATFDRNLATFDRNLATFWFKLLATHLSNFLRTRHLIFREILGNELQNFMEKNIFGWNQLKVGLRSVLQWKLWSFQKKY